MSDLLERVEAATGPDRVLDAELCCRFAPPVIMEHWLSNTPRRLDPTLWRPEHGGYVQHPDWFHPYGAGKSQSPAYTSSIDATLGLVDRLMPNSHVGLDPIFFTDPEGIKWDAIICTARMDRYTPISSDWIERVEARHANRCLAILAALLKAVSA